VWKKDMEPGIIIVGLSVWESWKKHGNTDFFPERG